MNELKNIVLQNLSYTKKSFERINKKLDLDFTDEEIKEFVKDIIQQTPENYFKKRGGKLYITNKERKLKITINVSTCRVLTAEDLSKKSAQTRLLICSILLMLVRYIYIIFCVKLASVFVYDVEYYLRGVLGVAVFIFVISVISMRGLKFSIKDVLKFFYKHSLYAISIFSVGVIALNISYAKMPSTLECIIVMLMFFWFYKAYKAKKK